MAVENGDASPSEDLGSGSMQDTNQRILSPSKPLRNSSHYLETKHTSPKDTAQNGHAESNDATHQDHSGELEKFDWQAFRSKYEEAIEGLTQEEETILTEFRQLGEAFSMWASCASDRDNERAFKRYKTRERFVQISEDRLETKKQHYVRVVNAFSEALALLR